MKQVNAWAARGESEHEADESPNADEYWQGISDPTLCERMKSLRTPPF